MKTGMVSLLKRPLIKNALYGSLWMSGAMSLTRRVNRGKALILTYHGVLKTSAGGYLDRICIDAEAFEKQMLWLRKRYVLLPLTRVLDGLEGKVPLPPYAVAITFDDGFRNNFTVAYPILRRLGIPATIFLSTAYIGAKGKYLWTDLVDCLIFGSRRNEVRLQTNGHITRFDLTGLPARQRASDSIRDHLKTLSPGERDSKITLMVGETGEPAEQDGAHLERYSFLDWDEVRVMAAGGIEFGSHTHSHAILSTLGPSELERELSESKAIIEKELSRPCSLFSYPNGTPRDFSPRDQAALDRQGYRAAATQVGGFNLPGENPYELRRINISRSKNFTYFQAMVTGIVGLIRK